MKPTAPREALSALIYIGIAAILALGFPFYVIHNAVQERKDRRRKRFAAWLLEQERSCDPRENRIK